MTKAFRVAPEVVDGKMMGMRVLGVAEAAPTPAKLGLRAGDWLRAVNGLPLGGPEQLLELYARLRTTCATSRTGADSRWCEEGAGGRRHLRRFSPHASLLAGRPLRVAHVGGVGLLNPPAKVPAPPAPSASAKPAEAPKPPPAARAMELPEPDLRAERPSARSRRWPHALCGPLGPPRPSAQGRRLSRSGHAPARSD